MRQYTCDGRMFHGFDQDFSTPHRLVLCQNEDTIEVFAIDGLNVTDEIDNLLRYFTFSQSPCKIIGTYKENYFRGFTCDSRFVSDLSQ